MNGLCMMMGEDNSFKSFNDYLWTFFVLFMQCLFIDQKELDKNCLQPTSHSYNDSIKLKKT